ncbi:hypothetical protein MC885_009006, partial [Smutsia gigantea]
IPACFSMAELGVHRIFLLVISLTKCLEGTKLLADFKKCGDLECETLISRVLAIRDYEGPDCRYLNFTKGEEISVYVKLAGEKEDLWAGSKGKDFGYFPRDAVQIEEVFISEEVQISTKESDFLCLLGASYIFENEDSELNSESSEKIYPYEEDEDQKSSVHESDFQIESGFYSTFESTLFEDQFPALESSEDIRSSSNSKDWEGVEAGNVEQDPLPEVDLVPPSSTVSKVKAWFGFRKEFEHSQESSLQSRKIAVEDGGEDSGLELLSKESDPPLQDVSNSISTEEEPTIPCAEILTVKEDTITNDSLTLKPSWFDFGVGMLGFAYANEDKIISGDGKNEEGDGGDKHEHPPSELDLDKEQEVKTIKVMDTEDQINKESVLEKTDDSDTLPYFKKLLYNFDTWNFQNIPKETDLPFHKQILDENHVENDQTEEFSAEKFPTDNMKVIMLKSKYSQSDMVSKTEIPTRIHEEVHFKTPSSKNNEDKSKASLDTEGPTQMEIDVFVENTLPDQFSTDYSLFSQNYIAQKDDASKPQILKYLFQIDIYDFMNYAFSPIVILTERVVAALPEDMRPGSNSYGFPWELVICTAVLGIFAVLLFSWRSFRSIRSRLYVGREKKLAVELSVLMEEKCKLLEKFSLVQKEYEGLESSLKDASSEKESSEAQSLEAVYEKLNVSKSELEDEIFFLEKELEEEKSKHSEQDELLLQEAEELKEQVNELNKQKITFEDSKTYVEQVLYDKENQITLNSSARYNQPKGALKKLIHAAKLTASLKTLEGERNQIYTQLSEVDKKKEELTDVKRKRAKDLEEELERTIHSYQGQIFSHEKKAHDNWAQEAQQIPWTIKLPVKEENQAVVG